MTKITPAIAVEVARLRASGVSVASIATRYGVSGPTIRYHLERTPAPKVKREPVAPVVEPIRQLGRWRVERGGASNGYLPGWLAIDGQGSGALFPTWTEAIHYAQRQAASEDRAALYQAAQNGLMKARSRVAA
ncbi:hypothetical protein [Glaciibacter flavus]|uniref:hypothetical protein n=1 Tax=Orlajensenia flava TaxID=2565934 RepID=UPI003B00BD59